ncbi:hypothetical protein LTR70_000552 [Exophiala xenobiotica]|uniref:PH domain-containing protein n=1 Tax=Lithohypha guttulata TaxID=1690604 RepID=A0ABR0KBM4_9EURO|nr:hypothetical protein LTR24_004640 [Lithohypha guttulata]KAK5329403.1 hypothetical protein LTR70_000552 [Exophiala xenobiotica]
MAATTNKQGPIPASWSHALDTNGHVHDEDDVFSSPADAFSPSYHHRFSSRFDIEPLDLSSTSSPSQLKRTIEAHLQETDRRLEDTQQLGTSLLKQRDDLTSKLEEVEQYQDEAQIPPDLQRRLVDIEKEHADVSREVARALIAPKPKQDDSSLPDSGVFTSQATGSPTKVSAPSRRHRNQPSTRAGDLQFAADISTSLLAQVRQLQATVAERDDALRRVNAEREAIEHDLHNHTQKIRALDESEQKYKDENWTLETQRHELLTAAKDAQDKEKRLNAGLASATAERNRLQNELEELRMNHSKLSDEHTAARKAHDTEIHALKRNADVADTDRQSLQDKIDELVSQNQELAKAFSNRSRTRQISPGEGFTTVPEESNERLDTPEDSPPASPTKATPRHGALESETLKSSLHHSHRMIQNLKAQNHREKTEKIELRRMLQEARDELESRREGGSAAKRQKTKPDIFKKPARPDMLGGTRRPRTHVELTDDDWEDQNLDSPTHARSVNILQAPRGNAQHLTDLSDAYQTANDTEGNFDTADERNTTESEAFMTGAESLAGDSTDELTETEDTASTTGRTAPGRVSRIISARPAGDPTGYTSNASASADRGDNLQTPVQSSFTKFKLRNNRASYPRQAQLAEEDTPEGFGSRSVAHNSPASTVTGGQSPAIGEQSLFAELGGMDEINSEANSTPARSSTMSSARSTPGYTYTPSKAAVVASEPVGKIVMVDSSTMTEPWTLGTTNMEPAMEKKLLPSAFPLPPSAPSSPLKRGDSSTQYTPQRGMSESPSRPTSSHITPPRTVWDEVDEPSTPGHLEGKSLPQHQYSGVLSQDSMPVHSPSYDRAATRAQLEQLQADLAAKETELGELRKSNAAALAAAAASLESLRNTQAMAATERESQLEILRSSHAADVTRLESQMGGLRETHASNLSTKDAELEGLRGSHAAALAANAAKLDNLRGAHTSELASRQTELEDVRNAHSSALATKESEVEDLRRAHAAELVQKETELNNLRADHTTTRKAREVEAVNLRNSHAAEVDVLRGQLSIHKEEIDNKQVELDGLRSSHAAALASSQAELEHLRVMHATESDKLKAQIASHSDEVSKKRRELETLRNVHSDELDKLRRQISGYSQEMGTKQTEFEKLAAVHNAELQGLRRQVSGHSEEMNNKEAELQALRSTHNTELEGLQGQIVAHTQQIGSKQYELGTMRSTHNQDLERMQRQIDGNAENVERMQTRHNGELAMLQSQIATYTQQLGNMQSELEALQLSYQEELNKLRKKVDVKDDLIQRQYADHSQELGRLHGEIYTHRQEVEQLQNALRASDARHAALKGSGYSSILSQETHPTPPQLAKPVQSGRFRRSPERPRTAEKIVGGRLLASGAEGSGLAAANKDEPTTIREDDTSGAIDRLGQSTSSALKDISGNAVPTRSGRSTDEFGGPLTRPTMSHDQGSQTFLRGEQLDQASKPRKAPLAPVIIPARNQSPGTRTSASPTRYPRRSTSRTREVLPIIEDSTAIPSTPPPPLSSVTSNRSSSMVSQSHPPLPSDHKDIIAKANQNVSPTRQGSTIRQGGVMGPPIMPASAMRRTKTPTESVRTASRVGQNGKRGTGSQMSRRSSVSSFASELDERFNIRADQQAAGPGFVAGPGTDPRMIQAITQTMIGEYLWKYTRKTGSKEMSSTRHRRYFWVHPYTKTLYWSDQDPQTAGRAELKAKSVAIESVRVVSDDNPMPPGLHRKSLEVTTPGRKVKFTASTGQRHETWFNALSYLLHRAEEDASGTAAGSGNDITNEDIAEFSVNGYGARLIPNDSRMSMSSYNSRTTASTSRRVGRQSMPVGGVAGSSNSQLSQSQGIQSPTMNSNNDTIRRSRLEVPQDRDRTIRAGSASRISKMFGSMTSRTKSDNALNAGDSSSQYRETSSIYDASVISDGRNAEEEEARRQREQVEKPGLEDVRACCDGKHHVGSLAHRHAPTSSTHNRFSNAVNRSMSRRT